MVKITQRKGPLVGRRALLSNLESEYRLGGFKPSSTGEITYPIFGSKSSEQKEAEKKTDFHSLGGVGKEKSTVIGGRKNLTEGFARLTLRGENLRSPLKKSGLGISSKRLTHRKKNIGGDTAWLGGVHLPR